MQKAEETPRQLLARHLLWLGRMGRMGRMRDTSHRSIQLIAPLLVAVGACGLTEEPANPSSSSPVAGESPDSSEGPDTWGSAGALGSAGAPGSSGAAGSLADCQPVREVVPPQVVEGASIASVCRSGAPIAEADFPRVAAQTLCSLYVDCGCTERDGSIDDLGSCVAELEAKFSEDRQVATTQGMTYSDEAAGGLLEAWRAAGCKLDDLADTADCCPVYNGTYTSGPSCTPLAFGSDCAPGSNCTGTVYFGTCDGSTSHCGEGIMRVCGGCSAPVGLGERCGIGFRCWDSELDLACNNETGICEAADLPVEGESCTPGAHCADGTFCPEYEGQELICAKAPVCTPYPGPGEPCARRDRTSPIDLWGVCQDGSRCEYVDGLPTCVEFAPRREHNGALCETSDDCINSCVDGKCRSVVLCNLSYFR